jgi:hypothetical protein
VEGAQGSTHVPPEEGDSFVLLGELIMLKLAEERAGASCTVFEELTQPGFGGPPHRHLREVEAFYVVEGNSSSTSRIARLR